MLGGGENSFPHEYSVSGWFKWAPHTVVPWRFCFRLTINEKAINNDYARLGDRVLALWLGSNVHLHWTTYTYTDLNGNGQPLTSGADFQTGGQHFNWHFVYYGYSRTERKAYAYVKFPKEEKTFTFKDINHYLPEKFFLLFKDARYPPYVGQQAYFTVVLGAGAFRMSKDYTHKDQIFGFEKGIDSLQNKKAEPFDLGKVDKDIKDA